ncbi:unnamed protein product [Cuscuta campestris]|uniref:Uncharacterized protein n=1 Tax=Cuscuta campestris TaxID=132261 RepID=A0A484K674_9ASTE|nr:unnamed protein product [Cuscuta campestris]
MAAVRNNSSLHLLVRLLGIINSDLGGTAAALSVVVGTGPLVGLGGVAEGGPDVVEILRPSFELAVGGEDDEADIDAAEYGQFFASFQKSGFPLLVLQFLGPLLLNLLQLLLLGRHCWRNEFELAAAKSGMMSV